MARAAGKGTKWDPGEEVFRHKQTDVKQKRGLCAGHPLSEVCAAAVEVPTPGVRSTGGGESRDKSAKKITCPTPAFKEFRFG